jgi:YVTN family beta-propeller protein
VDKCKRLGHVVLGIGLLASMAITPFLKAQNLSDLTARVMNIPNQGVKITPLAVPGARFVLLDPGLKDFPNYVAGQAGTTVVSPNHRTLLVLTSGYNLMSNAAGDTIPGDSTEFVFVFDITHRIPIQAQALQVPNTYHGIVFDPSGTTFYVSGGVDDDVHIYDLGASGWAERSGSPIPLEHNNTGIGLAVRPEAAGIAITPNGQQIVVVNYYNDSVSVLTKGAKDTWAKTGELDLRPGKINPSQSGTPGGEYPFWVVIKGNNTAYVSSLRDREIDVVALGATPSLTTRIPVTGQPNKMVLNAAGTILYVAQDQSDSVAVIDTARNTVRHNIFVGDSPERFHSSSWFSGDDADSDTSSARTGNNTNSVALARDEESLYVTNGTANDVAVVDLRDRKVTGLIPTGLYPNSVSFNGDGGYMYVVNGKSPTGPNPGNCHGGVLPGKTATDCYATNQYDLQLIKAGLQSFPTPERHDLDALTEQVGDNNHHKRRLSDEDREKMAALHEKIKHVIYVIKENRTYDQILGDLPVGNGDPSLTEFGEAITPNLHRLAQNFVTLDNFYDRSEVSMDGWPWSTSARAPDVVEKQTSVNYAGRGVSYDSEGTNRNVNVGLPTLSQRLAANPLSPNDPDVLPGTTNTAAPDGPDDEVNTGYLWDQAKRAGLSIRNYGFFIDLARYNLPAPYTALSIPEITDPFSTKTQVAYPTNDTLAPVTDIYFRGFDNSFPDYFRYTEFARDFDANYAHGGLPALSFVRLMHDHTGNFGTAIYKLNTPELQEADNDYSVGLLVQKIAHSRYAHNTLIFVIEDDSQDGGDHVDAHRSIAYIVGPYVKQQAVVSKSYNTLDFVRTMEDILGLPPLNVSDALAVPMADVFDMRQTDWTYTATASALLVGTGLPLPPEVANLRPLKPTHDAAYWAAATKGMDFSAEDRFNFNQYNHILWKGLMGNKPYPETPTGLDLRNNRAELLRNFRAAQQKTAKLQSDGQAPPSDIEAKGGGL